MTSGQSLPELFFAHEGKLSDKWEHYLAIYDAELKGFVERGQPVRLLEIGVQNGGSLEIWARYLPAGSNIVGVDIDPDVASLVFGDNIDIHILDAGNAADIRKVFGEDMFDIIVDDGSHRSDDIIATFRNLFGNLSEGGVYIIEDLHASYWASHAGGFRLETSSLEYLKGLVDGLNADHFQGDSDAATLDELHAINRSVSGIAFYDSLAVIRKLPAPKSTAYRRVFSGAQADVRNPFFHMPAVKLQNTIVGAASHRQIEKSILDEAEANRQRAAALKVEWDAVWRDNVSLGKEIAALHEDRRNREAVIVAYTENAAQAQMTIEALSQQRVKPQRGALRQAMKRGSHIVEKAIRALRGA